MTFAKLLPVLALVILINPNQLARDLGLDDLVDIEDRRGLELDAPTKKQDNREKRIQDMIRCSRTQNCAFFGTTFDNEKAGE
jgi:hypothetical protein